MYDLFSDFFDGFDLFPVYREEAVCPKCGRSLTEFRKTGKLGCAECYATFEKPLEKTLRQIHASSSHKGKIPVNQGSGIAKKRRIEEIKQKIARAVANEDYETAAALHKELKGLDG